MQRKKQLLVKFWQYLFRWSRFRLLASHNILAMEGGEFRSATIRQLYRDYYGLEIGMYSYGGCFNPKNMFGTIRIGRYCSFAPTVYIYNANHPFERISQHPFFYNYLLGIVDKEHDVPRGTLEIGNDVWFGQNSIILPSVNRIGHGAVIAAGAIVTHDVPDFAIVAGCPGKILRYRFPKKVQERLLEIKWWDKSIEEIQQNGIQDFLRPANEVIETKI